MKLVSSIDIFGWFTNNQTVKIRSQRHMQHRRLVKQWSITTTQPVAHWSRPSMPSVFATLQELTLRTTRICVPLESWHLKKLRSLPIYLRKENPLDTGKISDGFGIHSTVDRVHVPRWNNLLAGCISLSNHLCRETNIKLPSWSNSNKKEYWFWKKNNKRVICDYKASLPCVSNQCYW